MNSETTTFRRGDIVRVQFDPVIGHEQAGVRPALVLSPKFLNEISSTILVAAITSKRLEYISPAEVFLESGNGGLKTDSKVLFLQTRSIDKKRILSRYGTVSQETIRPINYALSIATGLKEI